MDSLIEKAIAPYPEPRVRELLVQYFTENEAARAFLSVARETGWPATIDHITIRCRNVEEMAREFSKIGYRDNNELIEYPDQGWWAKVYRKPDYPALFLDQAYDDDRGKKSILPGWIDTFGDRILHHIAFRVEDIEKAVQAMKTRGIEFSGKLIGAWGSRLRQIFTAAEVRQGQAYSVLELTERNNYEGFVPEQADSLMQSSTEKRTR